MKLRDHPLMTRKSGMKSWPPHWINTRGDLNDKPRGEIGTVLRVEKHPSNERGLFVWIEYNHYRYVGAMYFDDFAFCHLIRRILESQIGISIKEIGDLDL